MACNPKWERKPNKRRRRWFWRHPDKWTDYPFVSLGDVPNKLAPIRKVFRIDSSYHDKWVAVTDESGGTAEAKKGYLYATKRRFK